MSLYAPTSRELVTASLRHPLLDEIEERELLDRAKCGDKVAVERLIVNNQRLVATIAKKYNRVFAPSDMEFQDLIQAGNIGLYKAVNMWDSRKNVKFSTYAYYWIRAYVRRLSLKKSSPLSLSFGYSETLLKIRRVKNDYLAREEREPTWEEIAEITGIPLEEVMFSRMALEASLSLESEIDQSGIGYNERENQRQVVDIEQDTEDDAMLLALLSQVQEQVNKLPVRWKKLLVMRYGLDGDGGKTTLQIAQAFGTSRQNVEQMEKSAIRMLRNRMGEKTINNEP